MEDKEKCCGELTHVSLCKAENGWKISCSYKQEETLSQRAGWTPCMPCECKDFVEKTEDAAIERVKKILKCKCGKC
jgi:hypothetical protein